MDITAADPSRPGTFGLEDALPLVPLPSVEHSCRTFLDWCAPLLTPEEYRTTAAAVVEFLAPDSTVPVLQAQLAAADAASPAGRLGEFWRHRYLGRRDRIALNANFFFLFAGTGSRGAGASGGDHDRARRAAALVSALLELHAEIDAGTVQPVRQRGIPQSMQQYRHLFCTTRIPGTTIDTVRRPHTADRPGPSRARHIVVFAGDVMYRLDVIDPSGVPYPAAVLERVLREIGSPPLGVRPDGDYLSIAPLTTMARADWARCRATLLDLEPANRAALDLVETALFSLSLEETVPPDDTAAGDALLHGNSAQRWFDTAISLIVFADGTAGLNGEHCLLDGGTLVELVDRILPRALGHDPTTPGGTPSPQSQSQSQWRSQSRSPMPHRIDVVLDEHLRSEVRRAAAEFADQSAATATATVVMDIGSEAVKRCGVSPDAFCQLAFQWARHRVTGTVGATYESISMRSYRHGRTEAMRVVTPEMVAFLAAAAAAAAAAATATAGNTSDPESLAAAARSAAAAHVDRARGCREGGAPEQHLWELQLAGAGTPGTPAPAGLYDSPGWRILRDDRLSTSALASENIRYFGFGATGSQCIGIGYSMLPNEFRCFLSATGEAKALLDAVAAQLPITVSDLLSLLSR